MQNVQEMDRDTLFREAVAAAGRDAERKARREELQGPSAEEKARHARQDAQAAEWQEAMSIAIERAYANVRETIFPSDEAVAAISRALRLLAALDPDHATERNGVGFGRVDSYFGRYLAGQRDLFGAEAVVGKALVCRYRRQLSAELVAAALEESVEVRGDYDDEDQGDLLRPIVPGAAYVIKLEPVAELPEAPAFDQAAHDANMKKYFAERAPTAEARAAICEALAAIASKAGSVWAHAAKGYLEMAADWSDAIAILARYVVSRNLDALDPMLVAAALGEPAPVVQQAAQEEALAPTRNYIRVTIPQALADDELTMRRVQESVRDYMKGQTDQSNTCVIWSVSETQLPRKKSDNCGIVADCADLRLKAWIEQYAAIGVAAARGEKWIAENPSPVSEARLAPAPKRAPKPMKLAWKSGRWELKAHTSDQCAQAAAAGLTYDATAKKYTGPGYAANAFRECITDPASRAMMDAYTESYRSGMAVQKSAPVTAVEPDKAMTMVSNKKTGWWELEAHTVEQREAAAAAGFTYDPALKKYRGAEISADPFRHLMAPEQRRLHDVGMVAYRTECAKIMEQRAGMPPMDAALVTEKTAPKRGRGRPTNAELGRSKALSQVERNRRYRARRTAAAVSMPREVADRLAAARGARGLTTGALLAEALDALGA